MSGEEQSKSWWQTLPGIITGVAATLTALAGLVAAIHQTGWFASQPAPIVTKSSGATPTDPARPTEPPHQPPVSASSSTADRPAYPVGLPAMRDYKLGLATYTLLNAEVSPQTAEKEALKIRVRMTNNDRYDTNFWDSSFRLILGGVPMAPESGLNELVAPQSAREGDVLFVIPRGSARVTLRILGGDDRTEIPLDLKAQR